MFSNQSKQPFLWRSITIIAFFIAVLLRAHMEYMLPDMLYDKLRQVIAAKECSLGNGVAIAYANPNNLADIQYKPLGLWPPGFSVILAVFLKMGINWVTASVIINSLGTTLFLVAWLIIASLLFNEVRSGTWALVFLYWAVAYSPFRLLTSTDLLSLACFSFASAMLFLLIARASQTASYQRYGYAFALSLTAFGCSFFRFAYYPISVLIPSLFLLYSLLYAKPLFRQALFSGVVVAVLLATQLAYQHYYANQLNYLTDSYPGPVQRLYFEHLLKFDPVIVNSFFYQFYLNRFIHSTFLPFAPTLRLFVIGFSGCIVLLITSGASKVMNWKSFFIKKRQPNLRQVFFSYMVLMIIVNVLFIVAISLRYPAEKWGGGKTWTYVQEARYFALAFTCIFFLVVLCVFAQPAVLNAWWRAIGISILSMTFLFSLFFWGYSIRKYALNSTEANMRQFFHYSQELPQFFKKYAIANSPIPVLFCDTSESSSSLSSLFEVEGAVWIEFNDLPAGPLNSSAPAHLLVAIHQNKTPALMNKAKAFCIKHRARYLTTINDIQVEIWEINVPRTL